MPVEAVARIVGEQDTRLWRLIIRHVERAHAAADWSAVQAVAIDETSARRGHRYVTIFLDADTRRVLFMAEGRASDTVGAFLAALKAHGGQPGNITTVVMDMSPAYASGVAEHFPGARIVYDRFHLMKLAGEAVEAVRKELQRQGAELKGHLWALRGNEWTRSEEQLQVRESLAKEYRPLGRALALRGALQETLDSPPADGPDMLRLWCAWAVRSRLEPFRALARTIKRHWDGIVAYFEHRLTQGAAEAINGIVQLAKRRARGYRSFLYFKTIAYWIKGGLHVDLPSPLPT
jgi:transposase